jgi:hypothetical protein
MRYIVPAVAALAVLACRGQQPAAEPPPAAAVPAQGATGAAGVSNDELAAFVRWQRELSEHEGRSLAEAKAIAKPDPSKPPAQAAAEVRMAAEAAATRNAAALQELMGRRPLSGEKADLITEVTGSLFRAEMTPDGLQVVKARDDARLAAARQRFGNAAVDDILARESLIATELQ